MFNILLSLSERLAQRQANDRYVVVTRERREILAQRLMCGVALCFAQCCALWGGVARAEEEEVLRIAVVELRNEADLREREVMALTARVRGAVAERLGRQYLVMTRENILAMVDEQTCNDALAKSCEVEMGRTLGAHFIVSGMLTRLGRSIELSLRVHNTKTSAFLGARQEMGKDVEDVIEKLRKVAEGVAELIVPVGAAVLPLKRGGEAEYQRELAAIERESAQQARAEAAHLRVVTKEWGRLKRVVGRGGEGAKKAVGLFLKRFEKHPLGNPLEPEALAALDAISTAESAARLTEAKREQARIRYRLYSAPANEREVREMQREAREVSMSEVDLDAKSVGRAFSLTEFKTVLSTRMDALTTCVQEEMKHSPSVSTFKVTLTVQSSGRFLNARLAEGSGPGQLCVFRAIRKLKMQPFDGTDRSITIPFAVR